MDLDSDTIAQFCAVTSAEVSTAQQYLQATDGQLEQAVELFFATGGVSVGSQNDALEPPRQDDAVRERIQGTTDQIMDEEAQLTHDMIRESRRAQHAARRPRGIFNQTRETDVGDGLSAHERRLAQLFRPPFDIIRDLMLDDAKEEAQEEKRWILVNIQDPAEFACQQLNRDLWRNEMVKDVIRENFLFLQYDEDSPDGEDYRVLYPFEKFPHISILDPWTGEQQKVWSIVPSENDFLSNLTDFVAENGQQKVSVTPGPIETLESEEPESDLGASESPSQPSAPQSSDPTEAIQAKDIDEPPPAPDVTRIQLRFGDGRRVVRRFKLSDAVSEIYAHVKHIDPQLQGRPLSLTSERRDLVEDLKKTVEEANLRNSTILVEAL